MICQGYEAMEDGWREGGVGWLDDKGAASTSEKMDGGGIPSSLFGIIGGGSLVLADDVMKKRQFCLQAATTTALAQCFLESMV